MTWTVITDAEKIISALVDVDSGRALGPILAGEDAAKVLGTFVDALKVDPSTVEPSKLNRLWDDFIDAVNTIPDDVEKVATDVKDVVDPHQPVGEQAPPMPGQITIDAPPAPAHTETAGPTPATTLSVEGDAPPPAPADTDPQGPVTQPKPGNVVCPTCDGWRTVPEGAGEVTCPTCHGTGEILAPQPEPTAP